MADPDWLEVRVEDHGPGIPPDQLARVFEPFYRVQEARDRPSGGHGLGLAIAATAVRRHRGRIEASNRAEGGLCVRVQLPRQS
jgi:two-component system sensor histidine kinase CpxA